MSSFTSMLGTLFPHVQEKYHFPGQKRDTLPLFHLFLFNPLYTSQREKKKKKKIAGWMARSGVPIKLQAHSGLQYGMKQ